MLADRVAARAGAYLATDPGMKRFGLKNPMRVAKAYNRIRYHKRWCRHAEAYRNNLHELLRENGGAPPFEPRITLKDGWAIDTSRTLPHLDQLLEEAARVIRERGGRRHWITQYPFLRYLNFPEDLVGYPSFLDFITSSELLAIVSEYLGIVPMLSQRMPPGVRLMESNITLDPESHLPPRHSQLYHIDYYDSPQVYVLVLIEDVTPDCGPWTFLPASVTARVAAKLGYRTGGWPYRVHDEDIYRYADKSEEIVFAYPKGTVLFIDSSRCFHFGSRNSVKPRYMMAYGLQSPCRCDFSYAQFGTDPFPCAPEAPRLRRMVLE